jgi:hypothetical protein
MTLVVWSAGRISGKENVMRYRLFDRQNRDRRPAAELKAEAKKAA